MSGEGARFKAAGYTLPKPLIPVDGKPMLEWVVKMFPGENDFLFICRDEHMQQFGLESFIRTICPHAAVVPIKPHKLGPVYAVLCAKNLVAKEQPVLLSYCDYFMNWDFFDFFHTVRKSGEDGNVICYTGFHPHLLHPQNLYAGCKVDERMRLTEIREKFSYEEDKKKGFHSSGAYYFKTGNLMLQYFKEAMKEDLSWNGEFYVSMVYNLLVRDKLNVGVYSRVSHFCQWGTPEDLREYIYWSEIFTKHNYL
ncbi:MAG TPA: glycosyltransferase family 2 protein [Chitinophagales bacterium]|nr:glycosyltransferase family 2 protein [Chitinophagales bacterium]